MPWRVKILAPSDWAVEELVARYQALLGEWDSRPMTDEAITEKGKMETALSEMTGLSILQIQGVWGEESE